MKKIVVIGLGYLGATTAVALTKMGNLVIGIDPHQAKIDSLTTGKVPFFEPGLDQGLAEALATGHLSFHSEYPQDAQDADIFLLCVGTPQAEGSKAADLRYLEAAIDQLAPFYGANSIVVGKSTVPVGTAAKLKERLAQNIDLEARLAWNRERNSISEDRHSNRGAGQGCRQLILGHQNLIHQRDG
jgi:UDPglucose 6-dehydrogenase